MSSNPIDVERALNVAMKKDELHTVIQEISNHLEQVKQKAHRMVQQLIPIEEKIPQHLKAFIQLHGEGIDLNKLTPLASQRYTKYLEAVRNRDKLMDEVIELTVKLDKAKSQESNAMASLEGALTRPAKRQKRRDVTCEFILDSLKYYKLDNDIFVCNLPVEMWVEILNWLPMISLLDTTVLDKRFYVLAGNHPRFKALCVTLTLPDPNPLYHQTYKTVYATSNLGPKRCHKCCTKTTRKPFVDIKICRYCQP